LFSHILASNRKNLKTPFLQNKSPIKSPLTPFFLFPLSPCGRGRQGEGSWERNEKVRVRSAFALSPPFKLQ
jgi:hypothetical protein